MVTGTIKDVKEKGFGFIAPDEGGSDVFFHVKQLVPGTEHALAAKGARVSFDVRQGDRGLMAVNVSIFSVRDEPAAEQHPPQLAVEEILVGMDQAMLAVMEWYDLLKQTVRAKA